MSTAIEIAYQSRFSDWIVPAESHKSPQNKDFYGRWDTFPGKVYCIKDRVWLDIQLTYVKREEE